LVVVVCGGGLAYRRSKQPASSMAVVGQSPVVESVAAPFDMADSVG